LTSRESSGNLFGFNVHEKNSLEIRNTESMKVIPKIEKFQDSNQVKKAEGKKGAVETPAFG